MGSLGLRDLRRVYHPTVRADGRAVRDYRWISDQSVSVAERSCVPGSLIGLNSKMRRFRLSYLRCVQDLAVRTERHSDMISQISRVRGRDGAQCGENDLKNYCIYIVYRCKMFLLFGYRKPWVGKRDAVGFM